MFGLLEIFKKLPKVNIRQIAKNCSQLDKIHPMGENSPKRQNRPKGRISPNRQKFAQLAKIHPMAIKRPIGKIAQ
jgi:hypothetical protein